MLGRCFGVHWSTRFTEFVLSNLFLHNSKWFYFCVAFVLLFWRRFGSAVTKVSKCARIFAKIENLNCKYLFCPPVFFNIAMSICTSFTKNQFWYRAPHLLKLTNRDIKTSNLLYKLLERGFGGRHFEHKFLLKYQTNSNLDFRFLISIVFTSFECILVPLCENRYFQAMFTVH